MKVFLVGFVLGMGEGFILADWLRSRLQVKRTLKTSLNASQRNMRRKVKAADKAVAGLQG